MRGRSPWREAVDAAVCCLVLCSVHDQLDAGHWTGVAFRYGPARDARPRAASRAIEPIPAGADPAGTIASAVAAWEERAGAAGVHSVVPAVDPRHWEVVRFTLWDAAVPQDADPDAYEVLHVSAPHLDEVPVGRHWDWPPGTGRLRGRLTPCHP